MVFLSPGVPLASEARGGRYGCVPWVRLGSPLFGRFVVPRHGEWTKLSVTWLAVGFNCFRYVVGGRSYLGKHSVGGLADTSFYVLLSLADLGIITSRRPGRLADCLGSMGDADLRCKALLRGCTSRFSGGYHEGVAMGRLRDPMMGGLVATAFSDRHCNRRAIAVIGQVAAGRFGYVRLSGPFGTLRGSRRLHGRSPDCMGLVGVVKSMRLGKSSRVGWHAFDSSATFDPFHIDRWGRLWAVGL